MSTKLSKQTSFSYTKINSYLYIMQMDDMSWFFGNTVKQIHKILFMLLSKFLIFFQWNTYSAIVALCTVRDTLHHAWHFAVFWPLRDSPRIVSKGAPTQLQEVTPNAKSHKIEISFVKIYFLFRKKLNAFLGSCQWTITHYVHVHNHAQHIPTHHTNTWAETFKIHIRIYIKIGFSYKWSIYYMQLTQYIKIHIQNTWTLFWEIDWEIWYNFRQLNKSFWNLHVFWEMIVV